MIILVDMDGVLTDWQSTFDKKIIEHSPHIDFPFLQQNLNWDLTTGLDEEGLHAVETIMSLPGFYAELEPIPGGREALNSMLEAGHEVFLVTSPYVTNPTCASDKIDWAAANLGPGWASRVVITSDKTLVRGDILIDDKPTITGSMAPTWEHVLFEQSYNRDHVRGRRVIKSWSPTEYTKILDPMTALFQGQGDVVYA